MNPLPKGIDPAPVREFVKRLEEGAEPAEVMAELTGSKGHKFLLPEYRRLEKHSRPKKPRRVIEKVEGGLRPVVQPSPHEEKEDPTVKLLKEAWRLQLSGDPSAPESTTVEHLDVSGLISSAKGVICAPEWFLSPSRAVMIAADKSEADEMLAQLHQPAAHQGNQDDPFDSARWIAEEIEAPYRGWKFDGTSPVRLASEVGPEDRWDHVFLSPGCRSLSGLELLPAVRRHPVSLHFVGPPQP